MDGEGNFVTLEEIENLLSWQYKHLIELDDFLQIKDGREDSPYKSIFLSELTMFDSAFIGQTIMRLKLFRHGIGKDIIFKNKPINDFLNGKDFADDLLANFKKDYETLEYRVIFSMEIQYMGRFVAQIRHVLMAVNDLIIDREADYIKNLNSEIAQKEIKSKLLQLKSEKIKTPKSCYLRDYYREKELKLYELLSQYFIENSKMGEPAATTLTSERANERIMTTINYIYNIGDGSVINTGNHATTRAEITIKKDDSKTLEAQLLALGLQKADITELEVAIGKYSISSDELFGSEVNAWIQKMLGRALDGSWKIGVGAAGGLLTKLIKTHYQKDK